MRLPRFGGMRRRLSYANVMATLALFFALTGSAMAVGKYLLSADTIPATSDLAGSTYGNPVIAAGKVTTGKVADAAVTNSKLAASARVWADVNSDGTVASASTSGVTAELDRLDQYRIHFPSGTPDLRSCAVFIQPDPGLLAATVPISVHRNEAEVVTMLGFSDQGGSTVVHAPFSIAALC